MSKKYAGTRRVDSTIADDPILAEQVYADTWAKIRADIARAGMCPNIVKRQTTYQRFMVSDPDGTRTWIDEHRIPPSELSDDIPRAEIWHFTVTCEPADFVAVVADTKEAAESFGREYFGPDVRIDPLLLPTDLTKLYGHQGTPCVVVPGTTEILWHRNLDYHARCGRIVMLDADRLPTSGTEPERELSGQPESAPEQPESVSTPAQVWVKKPSARKPAQKAPESADGAGAG